MKKFSIPIMNWFYGTSNRLSFKMNYKLVTSKFNFCSHFWFLTFNSRLLTLKLKLATRKFANLRVK